MKVKFNDFGRCLVCCKNPCECSDVAQAKSDEEVDVNSRIAKTERSEERSGWKSDAQLNKKRH